MQMCIKRFMNDVGVSFENKNSDMFFHTIIFVRRLISKNIKLQVCVFHTITFHV